MMASDLAEVRRRYAEAMTAPLGAGAERIRAAFAAIPREAFLGPPPWRIRGAVASDPYDPTDLYADVLVVLDAAKHINNGSPIAARAYAARAWARPTASTCCMSAPAPATTPRSSPSWSAPPAA